MELSASVEFQSAAFVARERTTETVSVYTRHGADCPKSSEPYWRRCRCLKYLYIYHNGTSRQISAKTRSWEKAEQKAHEIRESLDPANQLRRQLEAKIQRHDSQVEIAAAADEFLKEVSRLNRAEATRKKYKLTVERLSTWCRAQSTAVVMLSQLDVPTLRAWVHSWPGAPTTRHNQHQRIIAFFNF
jgi:hypothetical protein